MVASMDVAYTRTAIRTQAMLRLLERSAQSYSKPWMRKKTGKAFLIPENFIARRDNNSDGYGSRNRKINKAFIQLPSRVCDNSKEKSKTSKLMRSI